MSIFSKLFGAPKPSFTALEVPENATAGQMIELAISSVIQKTGGNCATLRLQSNPDYWIQIMNGVINCHYPHQESPESRFPELCKMPLISELEDFQAGVCMTVGLVEMNQPDMQTWIEMYFTEVLSIDLGSVKLSLEMELI